MVNIYSIYPASAHKIVIQWAFYHVECCHLNCQAANQLHIHSNHIMAHEWISGQFTVKQCNLLPTLLYIGCGIYITVYTYMGIWLPDDVIVHYCVILMYCIWFAIVPVILVSQMTSMQFILKSFTRRMGWALQMPISGAYLAMHESQRSGEQYPHNRVDSKLRNIKNSKVLPNRLAK